MFQKSLSFDLPQPWAGECFTATKIGHINFLVGPNGSGKSKFAQALKEQLGNARLLGTDRLMGMEQNPALRNIFGDQMSLGLAKNYFNHFKDAGRQGLGIDTVVLLEERLDLRIQVEATLSHLFNRKIFLEWDSGNLQARAVLGKTGCSYRLDRDECHGIKELLVLLTHLYNDEYEYLIVDEPELNLHPQYQAFFLQEVRKVAGPPSSGTNKKIVFLVTHSPFILDFRSIDDVKSVMSFSSSHTLPKQLFDIDESTTQRLASLVPRLNVHHKQLFFSDDPIFVEGILDAQLVGTLQEARGVSVAGAGSCIIDAGGCEEVTRYVELCGALGKKAHFLYDLDSLYFGSLRGCIKADGSVQNFLATAGVNSDFTRYCGELDRKLTESIDCVLANENHGALTSLKDYFASLGVRSTWDGKALGKARVGLLTAISRYRADVSLILPTTDVEEIEGRLAQIARVLQLRNVHVLTGGTLERYLPSYTGNAFSLKDDLKRQAVVDEMTHLATAMSSTDLESRYGQLYQIVCRLPAKIKVDIDKVLRDYLSRYIHELQSTLINNTDWGLAQLQAHLGTTQRAAAKLFSIDEFVRVDNNNFRALVVIAEMLGQPKRVVVVTHLTNAGMGEFEVSGVQSA